jgi:hypothetical protein
LSTPPPPELQDPQPAVGDDVLVYRLIPVWSCKAVDGRWEFQSNAFDNASPQQEGEPADDMSVVLDDTLAALQRVPGKLPEETSWAGDEWGVAVLHVRFLRHEEEQEILRTPNEGEPAHDDVRGKKGQKRRRRLKAHADWVIHPAASPS